METAPAYVLGIDGLPLGSAAAVAIDGAVRTTFDLDVPGSRGGGVSQRVRAAVARAEAELGAPPAEVRLVLVDDGGDGSDVALAGAWLADRRIRFRVLDLVGPDGPPPPVGPEPDARLARSRARASDAALW